MHSINTYKFIFLCLPVFDTTHILLRCFFSVPYHVYRDWFQQCSYCFLFFFTKPVGNTVRAPKQFSETRMFAHSYETDRGAVNHSSFLRALLPLPLPYTHTCTRTHWHAYARCCRGRRHLFACSGWSALERSSPTHVCVCVLMLLLLLLDRTVFQFSNHAPFTYTHFLCVCCAGVMHILHCVHTRIRCNPGF